jgi:hypothetical protein
MKRVLLIACVLGMFLAPFRVIADENVTEPYDECYYHSVWVCLVKWADVGPERYWPRGGVQRVVRGRFVLASISGRATSGGLAASGHSFPPIASITGHCRMPSR